MYSERERYRTTMRAYTAYVGASLAYARFLRRRGRLRDPESAADIAALEADHERLAWQIAELEPSVFETPAHPAELDPAGQLSAATGRQLQAYQLEVCAEARRLRAASRSMTSRIHDERRRRAATNG